MQEAQLSQRDRATRDLSWSLVSCCTTVRTRCGTEVPHDGRPAEYRCFMQQQLKLKAKRIRGFTTMRYINIHFTYLLT